MPYELITVIVGLTSVFKIAGVSSRWLPAVAVMLGMILNTTPYLGMPYDAMIKLAIEGIFYGLVACGLVKATDDRLKKIKMK